MSNSIIRTWIEIHRKKYTHTYLPPTSTSIATSFLLILLEEEIILPVDRKEKRKWRFIFSASCNTPQAAIFFFPQWVACAKNTQETRNSSMNFLIFCLHFLVVVLFFASGKLKLMQEKLISYKRKRKYFRLGRTSCDYLEIDPYFSVTDNGCQA